MATKEEQSTDPSTPSAMRALAPTDPTPTPPPASAYTSTQPGVGPESRAETPSTPPGQRTPPMGLVVPAASRVKAKKNSVELLLEGMQGPQPERPKTTPQTDGQASASYHAEHGVRPARTSPDDEPKVVVERALLVPTARINRVTVQRAVGQADALRQAAEASPAAVPQQMGPRVIAAIVAGVSVVAGLFLLLRLTMEGHDAPRPPIGSSSAIPVAMAAPTEPATATAQAPPLMPLPPAAMPAPRPAIVEEPRTPVPRATPTPGSAVPRGTASPPGARPRNPRPAVSSGPDLGEFKTTFH